MQLRGARKVHALESYPTEKSLPHYATGGGTSLNHNTILGNVEVGIHDAGVPFKSTGSTNGQGELELIQTQMAQKPMLRAEVGMRVRCANKASAE